MKLVAVFRALLPVLLLRGAAAAAPPPMEFEYDAEPLVPVPPAPGSGAVLPAAYWDYYRQRERYEARYEGGGLRAAPPLRHTAEGDFKTLVLLLRFSDHDLADLPERDDIVRLFNEEKGVDAAEELKKEGKNKVNPTGSVRDVYLVNSGNKLRVDATVTHWIPLEHNEAYYASDEEGVGQEGLRKSRFRDGIREALDKLAKETEFQPQGFNFDDFDYVDGKLDGLGVVHSGHGAEYGGEEQLLRIWSHKDGGLNWEVPGGEDRKAQSYYTTAAFHSSRGGEMLRLATLCHEIGHILGLTDLYSTSYEGNGIGNFDLMSNLSGFDGSQYFPSSLSAYSKAFLGWADVEEIQKNGEYTLEAAGKKVYKIPIPGTNGGTKPEYLLLENRQPVGYDSKMNYKAGGIAVYHVDENISRQAAPGYPGMGLTNGIGFPENNKHYKVALLPADGNYALEKGDTQGGDEDAILWNADSEKLEIGDEFDEFPNTEGYAGGVVVATGVIISDFSDSEMVMTFSVEFESRRGAARLHAPGAGKAREARG